MDEEHLKLLAQQCGLPEGIHKVLDYLKSYLEDVIEQLAFSFNLFDGEGRPRRAFIVDTLLRFRCTGCIRRAFTQLRGNGGCADSLYREMHGLAVNMLCGALTGAFNSRAFNVNCEESGEYGRVDIAVRPTKFGVMVKADGKPIIVEVKTGRSISFAQLFRYLLEHPDAILIVWRVMMRQVFTVKGEKLLSLLCIYALMAINRALELLNNNHANCNHNLNREVPAIKDPQALLDEYFTGLIESLPKAVSAVTEALKEAGLNAD